METFYALLVLCADNSPVTGEFPSQRPVTRSFDVVFFDLRLNKRLNIQSRRRWFWDAIALIMTSFLCCYSKCDHIAHNMQPINDTDAIAITVIFNVSLVEKLLLFLCCCCCCYRCCCLLLPLLMHPDHLNGSRPVKECAHFCSEWSIVGYRTGAFWDLWFRSIIWKLPMSPEMSCPKISPYVVKKISTGSEKGFVSHQGFKSILYHSQPVTLNSCTLGPEVIDLFRSQHVLNTPHSMALKQKGDAETSYIHDTLII